MNQKNWHSKIFFLKGPDLNDHLMKGNVAFVREKIKKKNEGENLSLKGLINQSCRKHSGTHWG